MDQLRGHHRRYFRPLDDRGPGIRVDHIRRTLRRRFRPRVFKTTVTNYFRQFDNDDNTGSRFWKDLFDDATFKCYLSRRFHELTQPGQPMKHSNLSDFIDQTVALISVASVREQERWNTVPDLTAETENMKTWLYDRLKWMEDHLGDYADCSDVAVPALVINRINYNPGTSGSFPVSNDQEFIEIRNAGTSTVDLSGVYLAELGTSYAFPFGATVAAGASVYLASNPTVFEQRYGFAAFGQFYRNLSNNSQKLVLADAFGNVIDLVAYDDDEPWPDADGNGSWLELVDVALDNALASSWIASQTLATPEFSVTEWIGYPNPTAETLHIISTESPWNVRLFDATGREVWNGKPSSGTFDVDFVGLTEGMYFLELVTGSGRSVKKIVRE